MRHGFRPRLIDPAYEERLVREHVEAAIAHFGAKFEASLLKDVMLFGPTTASASWAELVRTAEELERKYPPPPPVDPHVCLNCKAPMDEPHMAVGGGLDTLPLLGYLCLPCSMLARRLVPEIFPGNRFSG